jgi:alanyl-tRNA synthetase
MVPIKQAVDEMGATALFGEKYGDLVRVITFDRHYSVELCGGTHVKSTGQIRRFKIQSESSVAAGVRRIEAITSDKVDAYYNGLEQEKKEVKELLGDSKDIKAGIRRLIQERSDLQKKLEQLELESTARIKQDISSRIKKGEKHKVLLEQINGLSSEALKTLSFQMRNEHDNLLGVITSVIDGKPMITVFASDDVVQNANVNCSNIVRELAKSIKGGGGGQAFYATAGGKEVEGLDAAMKAAESMFL